MFTERAEQLLFLVGEMGQKHVSELIDNASNLADARGVGDEGDHGLVGSGQHSRDHLMLRVELVQDGGKARVSGLGA